MIFDLAKMKQDRELAEAQLLRIESAERESAGPAGGEEMTAAYRQILAHMRFAEKTYGEMLVKAKAAAMEMLR